MAMCRQLQRSSPPRTKMMENSCRVEQKTPCCPMWPWRISGRLLSIVSFLSPNNTSLHVSILFVGPHVPILALPDNWSLQLIGNLFFFSAFVHPMRHLWPTSASNQGEFAISALSISRDVSFKYFIIFKTSKNVSFRIKKKSPIIFRTESPNLCIMCESQDTRKQI